MKIGKSTPFGWTIGNIKWKMGVFWAAREKKGDKQPLMPRRNLDQGVLCERVADDQKLVSGLVEGWSDLLLVVLDLSLILPGYFFWAHLVSDKWYISQLVLHKNLASRVDFTPDF